MKANLHKYQSDVIEAIKSGAYFTLVNPSGVHAGWHKRFMEGEMTTSCPECGNTGLVDVYGVKGLSFSMAFKHVKHGMGMRLPHWKGDVVIRSQYPDEHSKMTAPYLYAQSLGPDGPVRRVPWKETMIELFSEEWEVVI